MKRKSMVTVWLCVLALSILAQGCKKHPPMTSPTPPEPPAVAPPAEEIEPPAATSTEEDPNQYLLSEDMQMVNTELYKRGLIGDVYFDFDKYDLKAEARQQLAKNADFMRGHPEFTFDIEGHCDERGTNEYNLALGDRRASAAEGYLSSLGVSSSMRTISYGEERPTCMESTEGCWARNRRAHFVVTGRAGS